MATTDELKAALLKAHRAGDTHGAALIAEQLRNQVANVPPVPSDDYLGQSAAASADAINEGRLAVGFQNYAPGQDVNNEAPISAPNGVSVIPYVDRDTEARAKAHQAIYQESKAAPWTTQTMRVAGKRLNNWGDGLANIGDVALKTLAFIADTAPGAALRPQWHKDLTKKVFEAGVARQDARNANQDDTERYDAILDHTTGAPGYLGEVLAYLASGISAGPIVGKGAGLVSDFAQEAIPLVAKPTTGALRQYIANRAASGSFQGTKISGPGIQSREFIPSPKAQWLEREVAKPLSDWRIGANAAKATNPVPLSPMTSDTGKNLLHLSALGALENSLDHDKKRDVVSGALSGIVGGVLNAGIKPWVTRAINPKYTDAYVSTADQELMRRLSLNGMKFDPGMKTGDSNLQVAVRNLQQGPAKQMQKNFYTNQDIVAEHMYGRDVLGIRRPKGGFTSQDFADHVKNIDDGYEAIRKNTTAVFDEPRMTQVDNYLESLNRDLSPQGQAIAEQAKGIRDAMYGYSAFGERHQPMPYTPEMHKAIGAKFGEIHRNLVKEAPTDAEIALAHDKFEAAKEAEKNLARELDAKEISQNARRQVYTRDGDQAKLDDLAAEVADGKAWLQQAKDKTAAAQADKARLAQRSIEAIPTGAANDVANQLNTIYRLLGFNRGTRQASGFLTPDALQNIDKALSKLQSLSQRQGPKGVDRNPALVALYKQVQGALKPLEGNLGTRNEAGHIVLDGNRLESLRKDLTSQVRDLMSEPNTRSQAFQLQKMLPMLEDATTYHNGFTKEAATETRRQKAMWEWTNENQIFRPDKSLDLHALHKALRGDSLMAKQALEGNFSIPQKESIDLLARFQDLRNKQARSKQTNAGSNENDLSIGMTLPGDYTPKILARSRAQMLLNSPFSTTGLLNMRHEGPYSSLPFVHAYEQGINTPGKIYRGVKGVYDYARDFLADPEEK